MPAPSGGRRGEVEGAGRGTAAGARTRSRGGGEASASTGGEVAARTGQAISGDARKAPARRSSMAAKRKLDEIDPAPSPRRMTRASAATKTQKHDASKPSQRRTRGKLHINDEEDEQVQKQIDKDVRKKGSAAKLIKINESLKDVQKAVIQGVGFGGLLEMKCVSIPEKLSLWLLNHFDTEKSELVFPSRRSIKVDEYAVHRMFGIPMGENEIDYEKKSGADTFVNFYKVFNHEEDQKAPPFVEFENWLVKGDGKGLTSDKWLQHWLVFAISSFLCPTSSTKLCVRAFRAVATVAEIEHYNWCKLVVQRLIKGITEFKEGKVKFLSGCLFFLTTLYLDSLDVGDLVDQEAQPRCVAWTGSLVNKVLGMDKVSETQFGNLKQQHRGSETTTLIDAERIQDFINSNIPESSITLDKDALKNVLTTFTNAINQCVFNLTQNLCQLAQPQQGHHVGINVATSDAEPSTSLAQRNNNRARSRSKLETVPDVEMVEESDTSEDSVQDYGDSGNESSDHDEDNDGNEDKDGDSGNESSDHCEEKDGDSGNERSDHDEENHGNEEKDCDSGNERSDHDEEKDGIEEKNLRHSPDDNADSVNGFDGTIPDVDVTESQSQLTTARNKGFANDETNEVGSTKEENNSEDPTEQNDNSKFEQVVADPKANITQGATPGKEINIEVAMGGKDSSRQADSASDVVAEPNDIQMQSCKQVGAESNDGSKQLAAEPNEEIKQVSPEPTEGSKQVASEANEETKQVASEFSEVAAQPNVESNQVAAEPIEGSMANDVTDQEDFDTLQVTPSIGEGSSFQNDDFEDLTPLSSAKGPYEQMCKLGLMDTPAKLRPLGYGIPKLTLEPPEFLDMPLRIDLGEILENFANKESKDIEEILEAMNEELNIPEKECVDRVEANMVNEMLHPGLPKSKKSGRTKRSAPAPHVTRRQVRMKATSKNESSGTSEKVAPAVEAPGAPAAKEAPGLATKEAPAAENKKQAKQSKTSKQPASRGAKVEKKEDKVSLEAIKNSKGFKIAPDAPSFSLGLDENNSPIKSQENSTSRQLVQAHHIVKHAHVQEAEELYKEVCRFTRVPDDKDTRPLLFRSKEVFASAADMAKSFAMGRSLNTNALHVATHVFSKEPKSHRKKFMSPWVGLKLMQVGGSSSNMVESAFKFLNTDYDMVTRKYNGCTVPTIFQYELHYIDGPPSFKQFGIHDCGLFTIIALQHFDGQRLPDIIGYDELELRKDVLYYMLNNSANEIDWRDVLDRMRDKGKGVDLGKSLKLQS